MAQPNSTLIFPAHCSQIAGWFSTFHWKCLKLYEQPLEFGTCDKERIKRDPPYIVFTLGSIPSTMLPVLISFCNAVILSPFQIVSQEFLPRSWIPPALFYGSWAKHAYCLILLSLVPKDAAAHVSNHKLHGMESPSSSTKTWKFLPSSPIPLKLTPRLASSDPHFPGWDLLWWPVYTAQVMFECSWWRLTPFAAVGVHGS